MLVPVKSEASVNLKKPRVELTALLTDVAALTREKSTVTVSTDTANLWLLKYARQTPALLMVELSILIYLTVSCPQIYAKVFFDYDI